MKIIFATHNQNKVNEVLALLPVGIEMVSLKDLRYIEEIEETGATIEENSMIKARKIYDTYKLPTFAEDTGLEVDALNNAPGVYSARYAGEQANSEENIDLLLKNLTGIKNRNARFKTVATFITDNETRVFEGVVYGIITEKRTGSGGFGYDPVFVPAGFKKSFAEFTSQEKGKVSHRGIAVKKFLNFLKTIGKK
jgi:XTP/dITP diphosphohydrolase